MEVLQIFGAISGACVLLMATAATLTYCTCQIREFWAERKWHPERERLLGELYSLRRWCSHSRLVEAVCDHLESTAEGAEVKSAEEFSDDVRRGRYAA